MKLTNELRGRIKSALLDDAFTARFGALAARESELAFKLRDYAAGKHLDALLAMPEGFVKYRDSITISVGDADLYTDVHFHPVPSRYSITHPVTGNISERTTTTVVLLMPGHNLARSAMALFRDWRAYSEDRDDIATKVEAALNSATTVKRLIELWPDIEKYVPASAATPNLPAIPVDELNAQIERARVAA